MFNGTQKTIGGTARMLMVAGAMAAAVIGGGGLSNGVDAAPGQVSSELAEANRSCDPCPLIAASAVNLRSGPGTNFSVLAVIPAGAEVLAANTGGSNGFIPVTYNGKSGFASSQYLRGTDMPQIIGTKVTTTAVNMRTGPGTNHGVIRVLPAGTTVDIFNMAAGGYRMIGYAAQQGWVLDGALGQGGEQGGTAVTTSSLNLRAKPNSTGRVITVMPAGSTVTLLGSGANGYAKVSYNGKVGYAFTAYLN